MLAAIAVESTQRKRVFGSRILPRHPTFSAANVVAISQQAGTNAGIE